MPGKTKTPRNKMKNKQTTIRKNRVPIKTGQESGTINRDSKGRFTPGNIANPTGRPLGTGKAGKLAKALEAYESETGKCFVEHYFNLAFEDAATARDLASRLFPALKAIEGNLGVQQKILNIIGMETINVGHD